MTMPELMDAIDARDSARVRDLARRSSVHANHQILPHLVDAIGDAPEKDWRSTVVNFFTWGQLPSYTYYDFLAQVCQAGSKSAVAGCVELGWSIEPLPLIQDRKSWCNQNALSIAAQKNHTELLAYLIILGLDVNAPNAAGKTPLLVAIEEESCEAFELLRHAGATLEAAYFQNVDPFHHLVSRIQYNCASVDGLRMSKLLIEAGMSLSHPSAKTGATVADRMLRLKTTDTWVPELQAHELAWRTGQSTGFAAPAASKPGPRL